MDSLKDRIIALHGEHVLRKSAIRIAGDDDVFRRVLAGRGYKIALEIGTYRGASAAIMAQFCDRIITIDLKHGQAGAFDRERFWQSLGIDNIESIEVANDKEKAAIISGLVFDFVFLDGGHNYSEVERDFGLVKKCGRVLFHDAAQRVNHPTNDVYRFIKTLPESQIEMMGLFALWTR